MSEPRNKLEWRMYNMLLEQGQNPGYEAEKFEWIQPEELKTYTPDFRPHEGVVIETKGKWDLADRKKMVLLQAQYPDIIFCMAFQNASVKIRKGSPTSYGDWATEHLIPWIDLRYENVPEEWLQHVTD